METVRTALATCLPSVSSRPPRSHIQRVHLPRNHPANRNRTAAAASPVSSRVLLSEPPPCFTASPSLHARILTRPPRKTPPRTAARSPAPRPAPWAPVGRQTSRESCHLWRRRVLLLMTRNPARRTSTAKPPGSHPSGDADRHQMSLTPPIREPGASKILLSSVTGPSSPCLGRIALAAGIKPSKGRTMMSPCSGALPPHRLSISRPPRMFS